LKYLKHFLPEHALSAGRQRFGPLLEQELPEAQYVALHVLVPVDVAHVEDEDLAILGTQRVEQGVDVVVLEAPLACGEVLEAFHSFGNFVLYVDNAIKGTYRVRIRILIEKRGAAQLTMASCP